MMTSATAAAAAPGGGVEGEVAALAGSWYLQNFSWEESKYPHRRPLPELVSLIQAVSQGDRRSDF